MLLLTAGLLLKKLNEDPCKADSINVLCCYGMHVGPMCPLKLVKLTVDFNSASVAYEMLFSLSSCAFYSLYLDMSIFQVFNMYRVGASHHYWCTAFCSAPHYVIPFAGHAQHKLIHSICCTKYLCSVMFI